MALLPNVDRVRIWNSFLAGAWEEACRVATRTGKSPRRQFSPKLRLSDDQRSRLFLLAYLTFAVEARANHLIDELVEKGRLEADQAEALQRLPADKKWFLLPRIAGSRRQLRRDRMPHQAVAEICARRNVLFHVSFRRLNDGLPASGKLLALFREFVAATEDMNVLLRRVKVPRRRMLDIASFV